MKLRSSSFSFTENVNIDSDLDQYARPNVTKKQKSGKSKSSNTSSALARLPYSSILLFIIAVLTWINFFFTREYFNGSSSVETERL